MLLAWYGLPGSGKSRRIERLAADGYRTFDDFMRDARWLGTRFTHSRHADAIVRALDAGIACAIADIRLCDAAFRRDLAAALHARVDALALEWHCFDCRSAEAIEICRDNVRLRGERSGRNAAHALAWIDRNAAAFTIEPGAHVHAVARARLDGSTAER